MENNQLKMAGGPKLQSYKTDTAAEILPKKMKAVVMSGKGFENVSVREVDVPEPGPNQILARVDAAGVCTSILKIIAQGAEHTYLNGWDPAKWPLILGDEGSLTLVKVGENLRDRFTEGRRYGVQPAVEVSPINYRERYHNNARGMRKMGVGYTLGGQLAQYFLIQEEILEGKCLLPLPAEGIPYFGVSMAEPVSCVVSAQTRHVHIFKDSPDSPRYAKLGILKGGTCIVVGVGSMGKIHVELAMRYSPKHLIAVDPIRENLDWVQKVLGAKAAEKKINLHALHPDAVKKELEFITGGKMADDVILAVGIRAVQNGALSWLGFGGVANLFGGLKRGDSILELDNIRVHYDEIKVVGSSGGDPHDYLETLTAIAGGEIDPGNYVAGVGSLENAVDVLKMIEKNEVQGKVILYPHIQPAPLARVERWSKEDEERYLEEHL
jgi:threonine dehydrogenase-like Zn-dependent dehydrogenase